MGLEKKVVLKKKHTIKVPSDVKLLYCSKKKIITLIGPLKTRSISLNVEVICVLNKNIIIVTDIPTKSISKTALKKSKVIQGTLISKIKQILIEVSYTLHSKLNFVGVGYRAFPLENIANQLYFKLGYSHLIYFKIPEFLESKQIKFTKLFIKGNVSYETISQTSAAIRNCKKPEPYKGKGILYRGEKIKLKKGKKI